MVHYFLKASRLTLSFIIYTFKSRACLSCRMQQHCPDEKGFTIKIFQKRNTIGYLAPHRSSASHGQDKCWSGKAEQTLDCQSGDRLKSSAHGSGTERESSNSIKQWYTYRVASLPLGGSVIVSTLTTPASFGLVTGSCQLLPATVQP